MDKLKEYCYRYQQCKIIQAMSAQYQKVVEQNKSLQMELNKLKKQIV